ncbi:hypothetical protein EW145_g2596 [Phellinidium pouzarii]|uniref:Guanine nucleotide-binding protein alpha-4 subunit n=1 Tax=Phellinidium pouzarii TaxID=167371 RepID=A0A4S4LAD7_9AGAM|nr:hypothetical protein EW145_g2596 [Phellinidium pouzarii]
MIRTQTRTSSIYSADDPLAFALRPPPEESDDERQTRIAAELEAKRISDRIDDDLRQERERKKRASMQVKVRATLARSRSRPIVLVCEQPCEVAKPLFLLSSAALRSLRLFGGRFMEVHQAVCQAESGKSTLQKQFQLFCAPASLEDERDSWRAVVYFNVVRNIKRILQALDSLDLGSGASGLRPSSSTADVDDSAEIVEVENDARSGPSSEAEGVMLMLSGSAKTELATLKLRLSPLLTAESSLADHLSGGVQVGALAKRRGGGVYVRTGWQTTMTVPGKKRRHDESAGAGPSGENGRDRVQEELDKIERMLFACREDVKELWRHSVVKTLIEKRKLRLQESAEHFLNSIDRVSASDYKPSTDDILRARLQTMGIASHEFMVQVSGKSVLWHLYDVGGARGQRHTWVPYFDDANAIIFLAPVSAFDQYLEEDPKMNRINDSLQLFTMICSNELLKKVHLVLFLNKTDILKQKLNASVSVKRYIPSYGDRPNTYEAVIDYFRTHFLQVHRKNNEEHRVLYTHQTSVVDTSTTQSVIRNVRDSIFRGYLQEASLV